MKKLLPIFLLLGASSAQADIIHADDVIAQSSMCIGFDCVDGESFGFDTLRLKENNLRLHFDDTSTAAGFPNNDWRIIINDSSSGGANYFSIEDATAARKPFTIEAGAPNNSLYVEDDGDIGLGTSTPVVELHVKDGNTPTMRLEQDGSSGFVAQTWDVAGNETNFFIRDATNGSQLPFRIQPGADSNSLFIAANNNIGIATDSPQAPLHIRRVADANLLVQNTTTTTAARVLFKLVNNGKNRFEIVNGANSWTFDNDGNFFNISKVGTGLNEFRVNNLGNGYFRGISYALNHINTSSRTAKTDFQALDEHMVLAKLMQLPVTQWRYKQEGKDVRHIGPVAEDFQQVFGLGDGKHISTVDSEGIALAAIKAIKKEKDAEIEALKAEKDAEIKTLTSRLKVLEALVLNKDIAMDE